MSDVLIENYLPGKLAEMGLGYEDLRTIHPGLIYCSITGKGRCILLLGRGGLGRMGEYKEDLQNLSLVKDKISREFERISYLCILKIDTLTHRTLHIW